jgi:hypothetical protein
MRTYPAQMRKIIDLLSRRNGYIDQLRSYLLSSQFMDEPYNQPECFPQDMRPKQGEKFEPKNIGVNILTWQVNELNKNC